MSADDNFSEDLLRKLERGGLDNELTAELEKLGPEQRERLAEMLLERQAKRQSLN